jgi:hypothetical protein
MSANLDASDLGTDLSQMNPLGQQIDFEDGFYPREALSAMLQQRDVVHRDRKTFPDAVRLLQTVTAGHARAQPHRFST